MWRLIGAMVVALALAAGPAAAQGGAQAGAGFDARLAEALDRMDALFAEDRAASQTGAGLDPATTDALRESLAAMVLAAGQEGKPPATVERIFAYAALKRFGRDVPDWVKDAKGRLDTATLLASAGLHSAGSPQRRDTGYLSAIQAEGADTTVRAAGTPGPAPAADSAAAPAAPQPDAAPDPTPAAAPQEAPAERFVVVQTGDTLTSLALQHYGDMLEYRRIYAANRDVIQNPSLLYPGTRLRLPR